MGVFVLVPGAFHGAWCWQRLVPLLVEAGHEVRTPELLGTGADRTPLDGVGLATWADQVAELVSREPEPVILVGHSRGGIVISEVAERVPDAIGILVYLAGSLVPDGGKIADYFEQPDPNGPPVLDMREDGAGTVVERLVAPMFYNTTADEWISVATENLGYEPLGVLTTPLRLSPERFGRVKRAYIETTHDNAVPPAIQKAMQAVLPCDPVMTLDCDHSPFFSDPEALARCLLAIARSGFHG